MRTAVVFFFASRRRHTRSLCDWSSDVCSSDLAAELVAAVESLNADFERRWDVRLRIRTGVNTGEVVAGNADAGHGFVAGEAVNVAARLEQAARVGEVLVGEGTYRLARDACTFAAEAPV